jgi:hypothetical protein
MMEALVCHPLGMRPLVQRPQSHVHVLMHTSQTPSKSECSCPGERALPEYVLLNSDLILSTCSHSLGETTRFLEDGV